MRLKIRSIKFKILAITFLVGLVSSCLIGFSILFYVDNVLNKQVIKDNTYIVAKFSQQLTYFSSNIVNYSNYIALNEKIQSCLKKKDKLSGYDYYLNLQNVDKALVEFPNLMDNIIYDAYILDSENNVVSFKDTYSSAGKEEWFEEYSAKGLIRGFTTPHFTPVRPVIKVISHIMNIYDVGNPLEYLGKLVINVKYDVLMSSLINNNTSIKELYIFDDKYNEIYASNKLEDSFGSFIRESIKNGKALQLYNGEHIIIDRIPGNNWTLVGVLPGKIAYEGISNIKLDILIIILICLLIILVLSLPAISRIMKPLFILIKEIKKVSAGNLSVEIRIRSGDELEELADVFNRMLKDINTFIVESVQNEKRKRQIELQLFMSKINPHFIYNTLNTIIYLAKRVNDSDIVNVTRNFISILQYAIKIQPNMMTTVSNEIKYIENYVSILNYRYNNMVKLEWDVDENLMENRIPQMMLYPIVENSVFHGIFKKSETGRVLIKINKEEAHLRVCIEDDGMGIKDEDMERLIIQIRGTLDTVRTDHIGLNNVDNRLRLLFGEEYRLHIESEYSEGTSVWFLVPVN